MPKKIIKLLIIKKFWATQSSLPKKNNNNVKFTI